MNPYIRMSIFVLVVNSCTLALGQPQSSPQDESTVSAESLPPSEIRDLIVEQTRRINPKTASDLLQAVDNLINVGAYDAANLYLGKVAGLNLQPAEMARLHREFGTGFFLKLLRTDGVSELGSKVTDLITAGSTSYSQSPQQIKRSIDALLSADDSLHGAAYRSLGQVGAGAVPALLTVLSAESTSQDQRQRLAVAIRQIGKPAIGPLLATLASDDFAMMEHALAGLSRSDAKAAIPYLLRPALDQSLPAPVRAAARRAIHEITGTRISNVKSAEKILRREVRRILTDPIAVPEDINGESRVWTWVPKIKAAVPQTLPRDSAALMLASWLSDDLVRLNPDDAWNRQLFHVSNLGWGKLKSGWDQHLSPDALYGSANNEDLEQSLSIAMKHRLVPSAVAAAELLGKSGDLNLLCSCQGKASILASALRDPDLRIRFAAAEAILTLDPQQPFVGASDLVDTLAFVASASGDRKILLAHTRTDQTDQLSGLIRSIGFQPVVVSDGKSAIRAAHQDPDIVAVLMSETVNHAPWHQALQQITFDYHSRQTPICIISRTHRLPAAEDVTDRFDTAMTYPFPHDQETLISLLRELLPKSSTYVTTEKERQEMARRSLGWIAQLLKSRQRYAFYEFMPYEKQLVSTLGNPSLAEPAAAALGQLATAPAQEALVELANQRGYPTQTRQAAANALDHAIRRAGIMLTKPKILAQYERYNDMVGADENSAEILSLVLDSLERPSQQ